MHKRLISSLLVPLVLLSLLPGLALQIRSAKERARAARAARFAALVAQARAAREARIAALIAQSRALTEERKYTEAIGLVEQLLAIDPRNDYGIGVRPLLEDGGGLSEQRRFSERSDLDLPRAPILVPATAPAAPMDGRAGQ